jgi:8-oxo-dGTP diphosphatase
VDVRVGDWVLAKPHAYEQYTVDMWLYECTLLSDELRNVGVHGYRWVTSDEFKDYEFTPVDEASMNKLLGEE